MNRDELPNSNAHFKITQTVDVHNEVAVGLSQTFERDHQALLRNTLNGVSYCRAILDNKNKMVDWIYLDCNAAFERELAIPREQLIGYRLTEVLPGFKEKDWETFQPTSARKWENDRTRPRRASSRCFRNETMSFLMRYSTHSGKTSLSI